MPVDLQRFLLNYAGRAREGGGFQIYQVVLTSRGLRITAPRLLGALPVEMPSKSMALPLNLVNSNQSSYSKDRLDFFK